MLGFNDPEFIGKSFIVGDGEIGEAGLLYECHKDGPPTLAPFRDPTPEEVAEREADARLLAKPDAADPKYKDAPNKFCKDMREWQASQPRVPAPLPNDELAGVTAETMQKVRDEHGNTGFKMPPLVSTPKTDAEAAFWKQFVPGDPADGVPVRADALYRKLMPPVHIVDGELDRSVPTNLPVDPAHDTPYQAWRRKYGVPDTDNWLRRFRDEVSPGYQKTVDDGPVPVVDPEPDVPRTQTKCVEVLAVSGKPNKNGDVFPDRVLTTLTAVQAKVAEACKGYIFDDPLVPQVLSKTGVLEHVGSASSIPFSKLPTDPYIGRQDRIADAVQIGGYELVPTEFTVEKTFVPGAWRKELVAELVARVEAAFTEFGVASTLRGDLVAKYEQVEQACLAAKHAVAGHPRQRDLSRRMSSLIASRQLVAAVLSDPELGPVARFEPLYQNTWGEPADDTVRFVAESIDSLLSGMGCKASPPTEGLKANLEVAEPVPKSTFEDCDQPVIVTRSPNAEG